MGQLLAGQQPANRAIAQRGDAVGQAGVDQRLRANQAARAPGAVDHDMRIRIRRQRLGAQHQFSPWHADAAGNTHGLILIPAPGIQHHHIGAGIEQGFDFFGRQ